MVTLTGTLTRLDGTPASGTVRVTPSRSPIMDSAGRVVISGPQTFPLDKDGKLAVEIPASDDPDLGPAFTYSIDVNLAHASWKISKVWIPHGSATVDLSEIGDYQPVPGVATRTVTIPAGGTDGQVLVWDGAGFSWDFPPEGPQGPPGEVTTAALTTALAGKVTGTGMEVRVDNSVGTRVLLDHPGGTTMLMGDTGWRVLTSWDETGTVTGVPLHSGFSAVAGVSGLIAIRRLGSEVTVAVLGATITGNANVALTDVAFRPGPLPWQGVTQASLTGQVRWLARAANTSFRPVGETAVTLDPTYAIFARFPTPNAWPTTLPGTPL